MTANKLSPLARLAEKTPLKMNHTKVCVTVCDCEEPNLVLAVEADLSFSIPQFFTLIRWTKDTNSWGFVAECAHVTGRTRQSAPALQLYSVSGGHGSNNKNPESKSNLLHKLQCWGEGPHACRGVGSAFPLCSVFKKYLLALDNSHLGYLVSNLNKETCSYHTV